MYEVDKSKNKEASIENQKQAMELVDEISKSSFKINEIESKIRNK